MRLFIGSILYMCVLSVTLGEEGHDPSSINPEGCGQVDEAENTDEAESGRLRRYLSSTQVAEPEQWPWHVAIVDESGSSSSGSLINSQWVLTSAVRYL
jgi:hypothetical protein